MMPPDEFAWSNEERLWPIQQMRSSVANLLSQSLRFYPFVYLKAPSGTGKSNTIISYAREQYSIFIDCTAYLAAGSTYLCDDLSFSTLISCVTQWLGNRDNSIFPAHFPVMLYTSRLMLLRALLERFGASLTPTLYLRFQRHSIGLQYCADIMLALSQLPGIGLSIISIFTELYQYLRGNLVSLPQAPILLIDEAQSARRVLSSSFVSTLSSSSLSNQGPDETRGLLGPMLDGALAGRCLVVITSTDSFPFEFEALSSRLSKVQVCTPVMVDACFRPCDTEDVITFVSNIMSKMHITFASPDDCLHACTALRGRLRWAQSFLHSVDTICNAQVKPCELSTAQMKQCLIEAEAACTNTLIAALNRKTGLTDGTYLTLLMRS
jgi:hypothetical protein